MDKVHPNLREYNEALDEAYDNQNANETFETAYEMGWRHCRDQLVEYAKRIERHYEVYEEDIE